MTRRAPPDLLQGTLDLLILRTLQAEPMHGWAISERIQQISQDVLQVNQGSLYPALHRLEHRGWIDSEWAISELGRRARFYKLTASGGGSRSRPTNGSGCRLRFAVCSRWLSHGLARLVAARSGAGGTAPGGARARRRAHLPPRDGDAERLTTVDPNMGQVMTIRTLAGMETYFLQIAFWLTLVLGGLALVLTLSGLFSVLSYLVEQRTKEIGVRMALGATTRNIAGLVLSQSVRPIGLGLMAGTGLAAGLAVVLMSTAAASPIGNIVHVFDPVAYAASLLCILTACILAAAGPAVRASRVDPMTVLRQD